MKSKLIVLTDLWGIKTSPWLDYYIELLKSDFELVLYDSCKLAEIENQDLNEKQLHVHFINHGIDTAVANIIKLEKAEINILAFSIGGTIAWKAGLNGLNISNLYAISSTRLRYETQKPDCQINLVFGEKDQFRPTRNWADSLKLRLEMLKDGNHDLYRNDEFIQKLCVQIKTQHNY